MAVCSTLLLYIETELANKTQEVNCDKCMNPEKRANVTESNCWQSAKHWRLPTSSSLTTRAILLPGAVTPSESFQQGDLAREENLANDFKICYSGLEGPSKHRGGNQQAQIEGLRSTIKSGTFSLIVLQFDSFSTSVTTYCLCLGDVYDALPCQPTTLHSHRLNTVTCIGDWQSIEIVD